LKTLILTAFWRRPEISILFWYGIERLRRRFNIEICSVISDEENKDLARLCDSDYIIETENKPLGRKMNTAMEGIIDKDFDFMMQLGSDNLISNKGMETNLKYMNDYQFFGHTNVIMIDSKTKDCKVKKYGNVFGAGRCIHKDLIKKAMPLWIDDRDRGMDCNSEVSIENKCGKVAIPINDTEIIDVKSDENIWKYDYLDGEKCSLDILSGKITTREKNYIMEL